MGGFTPPIPQDDSNWEIRVAVLLSLFLQMILIFGGPVRKRTSSPMLRSLVWSSYLLADWVADLALGLLLNNMGNIGGNSSSTSSISQLHADGNNNSPIIFAFWTPFLLLHLGGPDTITAFSVDDNELWRRHLIGLLFELFSASVIFFCSLKSNPMIPATVVMFVVGIIKYGERTYSLYAGSVDGFRENILDPPGLGPNYAKLMTEFDGKEQAGLDVKLVISDAREDAREDISEALAALEQGEITRQLEARNTTLEALAFDFFLILRRLFANLVVSYKERKLMMAYFLESVAPARALEVIEVELNFIYDMVYTKGPIAHTKFGCVLRFVASACLFSSLLIFFHRDKGGILRVDVAITYALLLGGLALDAAALPMLLSSHRMVVFLERTRRLAWLASAVRSVRPRLRHWSETTSQLNLVSYSLGKPDHSGGRLGRRLSGPRLVRALAKVAETLRLREIFDDFFFIRCEPLSSRQPQGQGQVEGKGPLLNFVFDEVKWKAIKANEERKQLLSVNTTTDEDYQAMKKVCGRRGGRVLEDLREQIMENLADATRQAAAGEEESEVVIRKRASERLVTVLLGSVEKEFDESLLLWHIATDLCCQPLEDTAPTETASKMRPIGETLSEYMLYLLIKQPEMLSEMAGIGLLRYRDTCAEVKLFFESAAAWDPDHADARTMLLKVNTTKEPSAMKGTRCKSVLFDGVILATALRDLGADLMWEVVAKVWVEMLTYAGFKCRGSTHVRQLGHGGELITLVWFLMAHMGLSYIHERDAKVKLNIRDQ